MDITDLRLFFSSSRQLVFSVQIRSLFCVLKFHFSSTISIVATIVTALLEDTWLITVGENRSPTDLVVDLQLSIGEQLLLIVSTAITSVVNENHLVQSTSLLRGWSWNRSNTTGWLLSNHWWFTWITRTRSVKKQSNRHVGWSRQNVVKMMSYCTFPKSVCPQATV